MANREELQLVIKVDPETGKLQAFNAEMGKMPRLADTASKGITNSFLKAGVVLEGVKATLGFAVDAFKKGLGEMEEESQAFARIAGAANAMNVPLEQLKNLSQQISAENLIDTAAAMKSIADLTQAGFAGNDLAKVAEGIKNIAIAAGGDFAANMERISEAFLTGRVRGAELQQLLPSLKAELDKLPKSATDAQEKQAFLNAVLADSKDKANAAADAMKGLHGQQVALTNVTDDLAKAWTEGLLKGFQGTTESMGGNLKTIGELKEAVGALGQAITTGLVVAWEVLNTAIDALLTPHMKLIEFWIAMPGYARQLVTAIEELARRFMEAGDGLIGALKDGIERRWNEFIGWFEGKVAELRKYLPGSDAELGPLSDLTASGAAFWTTFAAGMAQTAGVVVSAIKKNLGDIMGLIDALGNAIGGKFGKVMDGVQKAIQGASKAIAQAMSGDWLGAIMTGIQTAINIFSDFIANAFKHDWVEDVSRQFSALLPGITISTQLMEQLAKQAEELGDSMVPVLLNLNAIIQDVGGLTADNINTFISALRDGFSMVERGQITLEQLGSAIDDVFGQMAEVAVDSFGLISDELKEIIALAERFGVESQAINDFISGQLSNVAGGVNTVAQNMNVNTEGKFNALQTQILTAFNAMIANGATVQEAMAALGPAFDVLSASMEKFGFNANKALDPLLEMQRLVEEFPKAFGKLEGINAQLVGLANTNNLTKETFKVLERQSRGAFNRILQDGKASRGELQSIAPTLNLLNQLSQQFGFTLDKQTQALIDQAAAFGFIEAQSPEDTLASLNDTMVDLTDAVREFIAALQGIPSNVSTTITTDYQTTGTLPGSTDNSFIIGNTSGTSSGATSGTSTGTAQAGDTTVVVEATIPVYLDGKKIATQVAKSFTTRRTAFNTDKLRFTTLK